MNLIFISFSNNDAPPPTKFFDSNIWIIGSNVPKKFDNFKDLSIPLKFLELYIIEVCSILE